MHKPVTELTNDVLYLDHGQPNSRSLEINRIWKSYQVDMTKNPD